MLSRRMAAYSLCFFPLATIALLTPRSAWACSGVEIGLGIAFSLLVSGLLAIAGGFIYTVGALFENRFHPTIQKLCRRSLWLVVPLCIFAVLGMFVFARSLLLFVDSH